jgi:nicotinamidase-related amidase
MSTGAAIADAHDVIVAPSAAATALLVVDGGSGDTASILLDAALRANMLVVDVELLASDKTPWVGAGTPGSADGCELGPGDAPNRIRVRTDRGAIFLASNIDLILRSNGISTVVLAGGDPWDFVAVVDTTLVTRGYHIVTPATSAEATAIATTWRADRSNHRGWQPAGKAADLLSSLDARIDPRHAALVLIDVQNDFCDGRGAAGRTGDALEMIQSAVAHIKALLAAARAAGVTVIHVRAEYGALYRGIGSPYRFPATGVMDAAVWTASAADLASGVSFAADEVEVCLPGSWGAQFVDGIVPQPDEPVVTKHRFSAFVDTGLELMLRARGIKTVILAGVTTNCCVESTAREVAMKDYYLVVAEDCVAVKDKLRSLHDASLESMRLYFGQVRPAAELIGIWQAADKGLSTTLVSSKALFG